MNNTCMQVGTNPDYGYTNFDNIVLAFMMAFQLLTMDFWENQYNKVGYKSKHGDYFDCRHTV